MGHILYPILLKKMLLTVMLNRESWLLDLTYTHSGDVTRSEVRKSGAILDLGCLSFHHYIRHSVCLSSFRFHSIS